MQTCHRRFLASLLPAAALTFIGFSAQAQTTNYYTTNFSNVETGTSVTYTPTTYTSPITSPTDPIVGQNAWASNDGTVTAGTSGTSAQLVGNSNYVGQVGNFFGGTFAAGLGGIYRTTAGSGAAPDVVPSAANAPSGIISLYHPITFSSVGSFTMFVDFVVTAPGASGFASHDTFSFSLGNATTNLLTVNFAPAAVNPNANDTITLTTAGGTAATTNGIVLNAQYRLAISVTNAVTGAFTVSLAGQTGQGVVTVGSGTAGPFTAATFTRAGVLWNLADKTATTGAFQNAGDNAIYFDNFSVPEPSTYAMMAIGFAALVWTLRLRRKQA